jgi:hypothetical protein
MFGFLLLFGLSHDPGRAVQGGRALGVLAFGATAWRAHGLGVHADDRELVVRTWAGNRRWHWEQVRDIAGEPRSPVLVLRDGTTQPLLDCWHASPESVGAEVRRRLLASRGPLP